MRVRAEPAKAAPAPTQKTQAVKAAVLAIKATGGKGFRVPGKSRKSKHRQGRGPPLGCFPRPLPFNPSPKPCRLPPEYGCGL